MQKKLTEENKSNPIKNSDQCTILTQEYYTRSDQILYTELKHFHQTSNIFSFSHPKWHWNTISSGWAI